MTEVEVFRSNHLIDPNLHIWGWEIPVYLFLGGVTAGIMVLTALLGARSDGTDRSRWAWPQPCMVLLISKSESQTFSAAPAVAGRTARTLEAAQRMRNRRAAGVLELMTDPFKTLCVLRGVSIPPGPSSLQVLSRFRW